MDRQQKAPLSPLPAVLSLLISLSDGPHQRPHGQRERDRRRGAPRQLPRGASRTRKHPPTTHPYPRAPAFAPTRHLWRKSARSCPAPPAAAARAPQTARLVCGDTSVAVAELLLPSPPALQTLVGGKSFGKGLIQSVYELSDGSGLILTGARRVASGGEGIWGQGRRQSGACAHASRRSAACAAAHIALANCSPADARARCTGGRDAARRAQSGVEEAMLLRAPLD